jgi:hypothetical protein
LPRRFQPYRAARSSSRPISSAMARVAARAATRVAAAKPKESLAGFDAGLAGLPGPATDALLVEQLRRRLAAPFLAHED